MKRETIIQFYDKFFPGIPNMVTRQEEFREFCKKELIGKILELNWNDDENNGVTDIYIIYDIVYSFNICGLLVYDSTTNEKTSFNYLYGHANKSNSLHSLIKNKIAGNSYERLI